LLGVLAGSLGWSDGELLLAVSALIAFTSGIIIWVDDAGAATLWVDDAGADNVSVDDAGADTVWVDDAGADNGWAPLAGPGRSTRCDRPASTPATSVLCSGVALAVAPQRRYRVIICSGPGMAVQKTTANTVWVVSACAVRVRVRVGVGAYAVVVDLSVGVLVCVEGQG
jgi:hypothetical protein